MKRKDKIVLRKVGKNYVLVPLSEEMERMHILINLNETSAFLWQKLAEPQTETSLVEALLMEYDVEEPRAREGVKKFCQEIRELGCLEE